jgi:hypothetical protein
MVNNSTLRVVVVITGIFFGGVGTGAAVTFAWSHNRMVEMMDRNGPFRHEMRMRALQRMLHLSAQQHRAISDILERGESERHRVMGQMMQACGEPMRSHKARVDAEIRAVLNPDQQRRFDELTKRQNERFMMAPGAPPPP